MTIKMQCPRCETVIEDEDEDHLIARVQEHVASEHDLPHRLPRKHILARLRRVRDQEEAKG